MIFKLAYPYPDFIGDSLSYIKAAQQNLDINIWPIGYSKFLRFFHGITHSDIALTTFQFYLFEISALRFYSVLTRVVKLNRLADNAIYIFVLFNPLSLYLANSVLSDSLFAALSMFWFADLLSFYGTPPSLYRILPQALYIFAAYTLRYNAAYYPIITLVVLITCRLKWWKIALGSALAPLFMIAFLFYSRQAGQKLIGSPVSSILSGWQLANNALYVRNYISIDTSMLPSQGCKRLDRISKAFISQNHLGLNEYIRQYPGNLFIDKPVTPLKYYSSQIAAKDQIAQWGYASLVFNDYGKYIIEHYPFEFVEHYVIPNSKFYFYPPLSKLAIYNTGSDSVLPIQLNWFNYSSQRIWVISKTLQGDILPILSLLFLILNIAYFLGVILLFAFRVPLERITRQIQLAAFCLIVANALFSSSASTACLRYEYFPMMILYTFTTVLWMHLLPTLVGGEV